MTAGDAGAAAVDLSPLDDEDVRALSGARSMTPLTLHLVAAAMVRKHAAAPVPTGTAHEGPLREAIEALTADYEAVARHNPEAWKRYLNVARDLRAVLARHDTGSDR